MSENVKWFKELSKDSIAVAGGKGANLGEMTSAGLPIPPGFVVTAQAYKKFIEGTGIDSDIYMILNNLNVDDSEKLQEASKKIGEIIKSHELPKELKEEIIENYEALDHHENVSEMLERESEPFVAVRSSATAEDLPGASFAGQQATFLNVHGKTRVISAVRDCWASLFTARAIYYRVKNNFEHQKVFIAVVVQRMVNSEKSGIMFSINPTTNDTSDIVIEAVYGLGEAIVSGSVNPDTYIVDKETMKIKSRQIREQSFKLVKDKQGNNVKEEVSEEENKKQTISDEHVIELAKLGKRIEEHYKFPQDIEWAIENEKVYIVQSRAVTTFKKKEEKKESQQFRSAQAEEKIDAKLLLSGEAASPGVASGPVRIIKDASELNKIKQGDVLVTTMTNPDFVPGMKRAAAVITDLGGATCHAAIVSREMGLPCVVGTGKSTSLLKSGDVVTVDGLHGKIYQGNVEIRQEKEEPMKAAETITKVKVNCDLPDFADKAAATGADGIGLLRLEFLIANGGKHPAKFIKEDKDQEYTDMLADGIYKISKYFEGKPVWVRTSDIRTDEYRNLEGGEEEPNEVNPMIGWHAIRRSLDEPRILKAEFAAIKKVHDMGMKNVGVMVPFVIKVEEVKKAKEIMRELGMEPLKEVEFGVMIETPAACWIIKELCEEGISFVSFGTNDLTQCTLGIDRDNARISRLFDEMHPAVLGEIAMVIDTCKKYHVQTSICGQAGSRPEMAEFLVKHGITSISANVDAVHKIKRIVAKAEHDVLEKALHG